MRIRDNIQSFQEKLFEAAKAQGFLDYEIYFAASRSFQVKIFKGEIAEYKNADTAGLSFRGTYKGNMAYFYTEKLDEGLIPGLLASAIQNAGLIEEKEQQALYPGDAPSDYMAMDTYFAALDHISPEEKIQAAKTMEKAAYEADPRVISIDHCVVATTNSSSYIANSLGLCLENQSNYAYAYLEPRVTEDVETKIAFEVWSGTDWQQFHPENLAKQAVHKALAALHAKTPQSGQYPVVFDRFAAIDMLETFMNAFYAEKVQKGFSLLEGKLGQAVASQAVTIRDDAYVPGGIGNTPFDSEGVAAKNKVLVENGILRTYLYNLKSAKKDSVPSTGNGFKASFKAPVETSAINFYIQPSAHPLDDLYAAAGNGILVTDLAGMHSGANPISGDFSLSANGFRIENGRIVGPIEQFTISGNFFTLLRDIQMVADDLTFGIGTVGAPAILVKELNIAGE